MKLTKRQLYLLEFADARRLTERGWAPAYHYDFIRPYVYMDSNRRPSREEILNLLTLDLVVRKVWRGNYTENTATGERAQHHKIVTTAFGRRLLKESQQ